MSDTPQAPGPRGRHAACVTQKRCTIATHTHRPVQRAHSPLPTAPPHALRGRRAFATFARGPPAHQMHADGPRRRSTERGTALQAPRHAPTSLCPCAARGLHAPRASACAPAWHGAGARTARGRAADTQHVHNCAPHGRDIPDSHCESDDGSCFRSVNRRMRECGNAVIPPLPPLQPLGDASYCACAEATPAGAGCG